MLAGRLRLVVGSLDLVLRHGEVAEFDTREPHWFGSAGRQAGGVPQPVRAAGGADARARPSPAPRRRRLTPVFDAEAHWSGDDPRRPALPDDRRGRRADRPHRAHAALLRARRADARRVGRSAAGTAATPTRTSSWIEMVTRLRATGMPIRDVRRYADLVRAGDGNEQERLEPAPRPPRAVLRPARRGHRSTSARSTARSASTSDKLERQRLTSSALEGVDWSA